MEHVGHEVMLIDYKPGEPVTDNDWADGRFCLECLDCGSIILGEREMIGTTKALSVTLG